RKGRPFDPVARFHLGNGAMLERVNWAGDPSSRGLKQSLGIMVNYRYEPDEIEANHEAFVKEGRIVAAPRVHRLARGRSATRDLVAG
ncbi:MAG: malonyl-CoA decarboxylase family protein, partial [Rhizobacter sp.]|nr:malonyl-CoA decarboxylase family protein [Rhizobacter sp.]